VDVITDFTPRVRATTLYVNETGSGGAYTSIQDAINAAFPGDSVFVYNGSYYENVRVTKTINLTGEDRNSTLIDRMGNGADVYVFADWANITGFTISNSGAAGSDAGVSISNAANITISYCNISNNDLGIDINSNNNNIIGNIISNNTEDGLRLNSIGNNITGNIIYSNGRAGLVLDSTSDNNITNNVISSNNDAGIAIIHSIETNFKGNTMIDDGILINGITLEHWNTHNIDFSNTVNGKPVRYIKNQTGGIVPPGGVANCSNMVIEYQDLTYTSVGITLGFSSNNSITSNNVSNNSIGIRLYNSNYNNISNNRASQNYRDGIYLTDSDYNTITNNNCSINDEYGVYLRYSNRNIVVNNTANLNYERGIFLAVSQYNYINKNTANFNKLYGIYLHNANENIISENLIYSNPNYGLYMQDALDNSFYYNNIINNTNQASDDGTNLWNNTYPSGGNYWSDYIGIDNFKGPNQDVPGSDGIGDTNYSIDLNSIDYYPLMEPFQNYVILKQGWNLNSIPLIQQDQNLIKVLNTIDGLYDAVQWYDSTNTNDPWKHNKVGKPMGNDLNELNETLSFWIHITNPGDTIFLYNGTHPTSNQTIQLHPGWNMVGYPSLTSYNRTEGLNNLTFDDQVDAIWSYDASTQKWEKMGESDYFQIGKGYYIHAKSECEWEVPL
jgi:parallel beta-helix repeat protein